MSASTPSPQGLQPWAVADAATRGRQHPEAAASADSPFELDCDRIRNCTAFRRLLKTQVFAAGTGDHFRTRLTHTLEVAAAAQRLSRRLGLNEHLACAAALAHDLGHPPFGHAGETALAELLADHGGFEHNLQSLRVVDYLEHPYPAFRGLNLTFEVRESLLKHCTPYDRPETAPRCDEGVAPLLAVGPMPSLEGQAANLADAMAYTLHDIEDGLMECGLTEDALATCVLWREAAEATRREFPSRPLAAVRRPILDRMAQRLADDAAEESRRRIDAAGVADVDAVRRHGAPLVGSSAELAAGLAEVQALLVRLVYRNRRVVRMDAKARRIIQQVFEAYLSNPELLPERFRGRIPTWACTG